jgi:transcriptional regulator of acetoin/glycerol metabolism
MELYFDPTKQYHTMSKKLAAVERAHILQIYKECGWCISKTAKVLGIGRATLYRKLKEYEVKYEKKIDPRK